MKFSEINMNTTLNDDTLAEALNEKAQQTIEAGPEVLSRRTSGIPPFEISDWVRIQDMYASAKAVETHEFLRSDAYTDEQKREALEPYVGQAFGDTNEELEVLLRMSSQVDMIDDLLLRDEQRSELTENNRELYLSMLQECGNIMIDTMIGSTDDAECLKKVEADAEAIQQLRRTEYECTLPDLTCLANQLTISTTNIDDSKNIDSEDTGCHRLMAVVSLIEAAFLHCTPDELANGIFRQIEIMDTDYAERLIESSKQTKQLHVQIEDDDEFHNHPIVRENIHTMTEIALALLTDNDAEADKLLGTLEQQSSVVH